MQQETVAVALEREHKEIDDALATFAEHLANGDRRLDILAPASTALRRHIYVEEEFLFPALRDAGFVAPVFVMLREHGEIWQALDELEDDKHASHRDAYERLATVLQAHNEKEEAILYPVSDSALQNGQGERLLDFLAHGTIPPGWVSERLRQ